MGNKHKKQMRARRVQETRAKQRQQLESKGKSAKGNKKPKFVPIREMPVIVFVRGEDYEPVKYGMKESREASKDELMSVEGVEEPHDVLEVVDQDQQIEPEIELAEAQDELSSELEVEQDELEVSLDPSDAEELPLEDPEEENLEADVEDSSEAGDLSVELSAELEELDEGSPFDPESLFDDLDSDAEMLNGGESDFIALDGGYAQELSAFEDEDDSELELDDTMEMDVDFNDMDYDELVQFGHGIDDDYSYDLDADSDADDIISGLISGASLDAFASKHAKPSKRLNKQPLSKRRRERLEARDAQRAQNFGKGPALWQKYPTGLSIHEVVEELQTLVATPNLHEIQFPPLDHNANWYVEQLANLHNLKSKSFTKNHANCIRVIKTSRSGPPEYNKLQRLLKRRQNFWRVDVDRAPREKGERDGGRTKTSRPKEGDIVGHNARAVDEGFGHRMLLEMGWNTGSGLGKLKDGIQAPLLARVKLTKRGL